jgi:hypothetical protein
VHRIAILAVLIAGAARADVNGDDVDDHPLASDLRAAFGRGLSSCRGGECSFDLSAVECTTRGERPIRGWGKTHTRLVDE